MIFEESLRDETVKMVAQKMLLAARTAPKARGKDLLVLGIIEGEEIKKVSEKMKQIAQDIQHPGFLRDGDNILSASVIVVLGSKIESLKLKKCGMCGFENCIEKDKHPKIPCALNSGDLGIAVGSASRVAMDHCVDSRIMYTVGQAVMDLGLIDPEVHLCYGIPLSCSGKNPFFDRTTTK